MLTPAPIIFVLFVFFYIVLLYAILRMPELIISVLVTGQFILHLTLVPMGGGRRGDFHSFLPLYLLAVGFIYFHFLRISSLKGKARRYVLISKRWLNTRSTKIIFLNLLFVIMLSTSLIYTPSPNYGIRKIVGFILSSISIMFISYFFINEEKQRIRLYKFIYIIGLLNGIFTFILVFQKYGMTFGLRGFGMIAVDELSLGGANFAISTGFGRRVGLTIIFGLCLLLTQQRGKFKSMVAMTLPFLGILLLLSGSRGPIISFVMVILLLLIIIKKKRSKQRILIMGFTCLVLFLLLLPFFGEGRDKIFNRFMHMGSDRNVLNRFALYRSAIELFSRHSLIGVGVGGYSQIVSSDVRLYPHNIFLEIMTELGIVGMSIFIFILFSNIGLYKHLLKIIPTRSSEDTFVYFGFLILIFGILNAMVSADLTWNEYIWLGSSLLIIEEKLLISNRSAYVGK